MDVDAAFVGCARVHRDTRGAEFFFGEVDVDGVQVARAQNRGLVPHPFVEEHDFLAPQRAGQIALHAVEALGVDFHGDHLRGALGQRGVREQAEVRAGVDHDVPGSHAVSIGLAVDSLVLLGQHDGETPEVPLVGNPEATVGGFPEVALLLVLAQRFAVIHQVVEPGVDAVHLAKTGDDVFVPADRIVGDRGDRRDEDLLAETRGANAERCLGQGCAKPGRDRKQQGE